MTKARIQAQHIIFNIYYFSTAAMVTRTRLDLTLYGNCLSCVSLIYGVLFVMFVFVMLYDVMFTRLECY